MNYKTDWDDTISWENSICRWDEGIPLGSGRCGCLCWGTPDSLRFSLDRTDIWDKTAQWSPTEAFTYQNMVDLVHKGDEEQIRKIFDAPYYYPTPTKLPAGKILIHFSTLSAHSPVHSHLSLKNACACMHIGNGQTAAALEAWIHAKRHVGIITIAAPPDCFEAELLSPDFGIAGEADTVTCRDKDRQISQGTLRDLTYAPARYGAELHGPLRLEWFLQEICADFSYGIVMAVETGRTQTRLAWQIISSEDGSCYLEQGKRAVTDALLADPDDLFAEHKDWWHTYWSQSGISLPDARMQKQWYLSNYLFASASRKGSAPMPLQGVWTADDGTLPPWKGDYHHDLNTELSYSHYLKANHLEEGESFLDLLWSLRKRGQEFAKTFYHADGCCLPGVMTIDGQPLGGWGMYSLSPTNQVWIARCFSEHYRYTGNKTFLQDRAYPYLRDTGCFIEDLLVERADGTLALPISSSPEIHDDTIRAWLTPMSNYDLALIRDLYATLLKLSKELGQDDDTRKWERLLKKLPPLSVSEEHVLMLSPDEQLTESHRHMSNAIAISPLGLLSYKNKQDAAIIDACIRDYEKLGTNNWVGYTFPWMSHLYAAAGNGEKAAGMLAVFWDCFCGPNGFHLNGDYKHTGHSDFTYRPFTLEGNMFAADALQEMLFQMKNAEIALFPAIPTDWARRGVSFATLRGENGLLCSASLSESDRVCWEIYAPQAMTVTVHFKQSQKTRRLDAKETWRDTFS